MRTQSRYGSQAIIGGLLILVGAAMLLNNQGLFSLGPIWRYWPLIVVGTGIVKFYQARTREEQSSGVFLFLIGLWMLVSVLHLWDLNFHDTWPAVLIAVGVSMLWKHFPPIQSSELAQEQHHG